MAPLNRRLSHSIVEVPAAPLSAPLPSLSASPWSSPFSSLNRTLAHRRAKTKAKTEVVPNPSTPDLANAQDNGLLGGIEEAIKKKESEIELKVDFKQSETRAGRVAMFLRRYLLHDWRDSFNPDNERSYIDAQTKSLRLLMKVLCGLTWLHFVFMTISINIRKGAMSHPTRWGMFSMYAVILPVTLTLPLVACRPFRLNRWVETGILAANAYVFAYVVLARSLACKISPSSFDAQTCGGTGTLSAAQSLYATLGPLFMLVIGRLHRGVCLLLGGILVCSLGWTLSATPTADWQVVCYMSGFYIWTTLLSYWNEKIDREKYYLRQNLSKQIEATARAQAGEEREAASKRRFVSYLFHEVRQPLHCIAVGLANLEDDALFAHCDPAQQAVLDAVKSNLRMMEDLLNDVLLFEKMQSGRLLLQSRPFDVNASAQAAVSAFENVAADKGVTLTSSFDEKLSTVGGGWVLGDDVRYRQITNNFISNSLKFTRAGGIVNITTSLTERSSILYSPSTSPLVTETATEMTATGGLAGNSSRTLEVPVVKTVCIRTSVTDTGCGIPADQVGNLFKPYIQIDSLKTQNGKGTGLGLAICKHIIELAGGTCGVESTLGVGSTFWFELEWPVASKQVLDRAASTYIDDSLAATLERSDANALLRPGSDTDSEALPANASVVANRPSAPALFRNLPFQPSSPTFQPSIASNSSKREAAPIAPPVLPAGSPLRALHILVADDCPVTRMLMERLLTRMGHSVVLAHDGQNALDLLDRHNRQQAPAELTSAAGWPTPPPEDSSELLELASTTVPVLPFDCVLLDNQMPNLTGEQAVRVLRKDWGMELPVIGITGNALRDDQDKFLEAGACLVITKPLRKEDLRKALDGVARVAAAKDQRT